MFRTIFSDDEEMDNEIEADDAFEVDFDERFVGSQVGSIFYTDERSCQR